MDTLQDLFEDMLKDMYFAEKALLKAMPKMAKAAHSEELRLGMTGHLEETKKQVVRIEQIFKLLDQKPVAKECPAMKGLLEEAESLMDEVPASPLLDAGMAAHGRAVEHYEMARYTILHEWATTLGQDEVATLIGQSLDEEETFEEMLADLATEMLNPEANGQTDDEDDMEQPSVVAAKAVKQSSSKGSKATKSKSS